MFRYVMDKVGKVLPVALLIIVAGIGIIFFGYVQSDEMIALVFGIVMAIVGLLFLGMTAGTAIGNLMEWKAQGNLQEILDEYTATAEYMKGVRLGKNYLFFTDGAIAYSNIRSMHPSTKQSKHSDGSATTFFVLSAGVAGGTTKEIMRLTMNTSHSAGKANDAFKHVMDVVAEKNPKVRFTYPKF